MTELEWTDLCIRVIERAIQITRDPEINTLNAATLMASRGDEEAKFVLQRLRPGRLN